MWGSASDPLAMTRSLLQEANSDTPEHPDMKKANGEDKPWITGPADRGPPWTQQALTLEGPLPVYFQVTSSRIRLLSSGMYFLSQAQQWTCWSVGEIMKKLKVRPKVIKTRQQQNDQEAGSQLE